MRCVKRPAYSDDTRCPARPTCLPLRKSPALCLRQRGFECLLRCLHLRRGLRLDRPSTAIDATVSRKRRIDIYQFLHRDICSITPCAAPVARPAALSAFIASLYDSSLIALARLVLIRLPTDALVNSASICCAIFFIANAWQSATDPTAPIRDPEGSYHVRAGQPQLCRVDSALSDCHAHR